MRTVEPAAGYEGFRAAARALLATGTAPAAIAWRDPHGGQDSLFVPPPTPLPVVSAGSAARVPRRFAELARYAICHRDPERLPLLYRVLWRLTHGEPELLSVTVDDDVLALERMAKSVRRDAHKMKAFVRFRRIERQGEEWYVAWHRPDHRIVRLLAPFFRQRFNDQRWAILTPDDSVTWNRDCLQLGPGVARDQAPDGDELERLWRTYYASIFNPARLKVRAMKAELPVKHWHTLPEAALIPGLMHQARGRTEEMMALEFPHAEEFIPADVPLSGLARAVDGCRACPLYEQATQGVFGEGPESARIMMVGEQPGDEEDRRGRPFVGPAGGVLDEALAEVGIPREQVWVTNAVKHFKWEPRGKRRLHKKPTLTEVRACRPWLAHELQRVKPEMLVCLGATAAQSLFGASFRLTRQRGQPIETEWAPWAIATYHPSALLRMPRPELKEEARRAFLSDLAQVAARLAQS